MAANVLQSAGYTGIVDVACGFMAWTQIYDWVYVPNKLTKSEADKQNAAVSPQKKQSKKAEKKMDEKFKEMMSMLKSSSKHRASSKSSLAPKSESKSESE